MIKIDLEQLLKIALTNLDQIDKYDEYIAYLHSEWYYSSQDLLLAKENNQLWSSLCLPGRLKIELMKLINNVCTEDFQIDTIDDIDNKISCNDDVNDAENTRHSIDDNQWICCMSNEYDCYYYYNTVTQESIWEPPPVIQEGFMFTEVFQYSEEIQQWTITSFDHNKIYPNSDHHTAYICDDSIQNINNDNYNLNAYNDNGYNECAITDNTKSNDYKQTAIRLDVLNKTFTRPRTIFPSKFTVEEINNSIYSTDEEKEELSPPVTNRVHVNDYSRSSRYRSGNTNTQSVGIVSNIKSEYEYYGEGGWTYSVADIHRTDQLGILDYHHEGEEEESDTILQVNNIQLLESTTGYDIIDDNSSKSYVRNVFTNMMILNSYGDVDDAAATDDYYGYSNEGSYGTYLEPVVQPSAPYVINEQDSDPTDRTTSTTTAVAQPIIDDGYIDDSYLVVHADSSSSRLLMYDESDDLFEFAMESTSETNKAAAYRTTTPYNGTGMNDSNKNYDTNTYAAVPKKKKIGKLFRMNLFGKNVIPKVPLTPPPLVSSQNKSTTQLLHSPITSNHKSNIATTTPSNKLLYRSSSSTLSDQLKLKPQSNNINFTTDTFNKYHNDEYNNMFSSDDAAAYCSKISNKFDSKKQQDGQLSRIQRLMNMGFQEHDVIIALEQCNGHLEDAANILIEKHKAINVSNKYSLL